MAGLDNPLHILVLLMLALLVFGAKRLPEMGRSLGSGLRGFKDALTTNETQPQQVLAPPDGAQESQPPTRVAAGD
jgi:sec-independent protein translocase protein TatA